MSVLRVSSSSFRKTLIILYQKKNLIFLVTRNLSFAYILRVSTVIITLIIITMFLSTCRSYQQTFSNKQNRVHCSVFLQLSGFCSHLRRHWRQREMFFKNSCWQWSTTKVISTDTQKQTLLLLYKSVCQCLRKMSQTNFINQNAYYETLRDTKV